MYTNPTILKLSKHMPSPVQAQPVTQNAASRIMPRIEELAAFSESPDCLTRRFATPEHRQANDLVAHWMRNIGMRVWEDAIGNVIGRYESGDVSENTPAIVLGSHLDTVINAGRFDGMLGILSALACVESLKENNIQIPYAIEIIGFADEEGVRYQSTYLGSRALTGDLDATVLSRTDDLGITMTDALKQFGTDARDIVKAARKSTDFIAYLELHIEQGPVLEAHNAPVGVVSSISGASRLMVHLTGYAGHAGTVPMGLRRDALVAAAQCICMVEEFCSTTDGLVGTVGRIVAKPGAGNVIAGDVRFSIDLRAASDDVRTERVKAVVDEMTRICGERNIDIDVDYVHEASSVACNPEVMKHMQTAVTACGAELITLPSGAGHDAAAMADMTPVGMLFVRCEGGVSHHPDENVTEHDAIAGAQVLMQTVLNMCQVNSTTEPVAEPEMS